jgi:uncharacterized RDD family membrane protein YckC
MTAPSADISPPAGLLRRLAAILYDALLLVAVLFIATALVLPLTGGEAVPRGNPYYAAYLLSVCFLFFAWFWTHGGQTLGMRAWKIRVQQTDGDGITWLQALVRFSVATISWLALGMGFFWMLIDRDKMTWHDRFSDTVLVLIKR